MKYAMKSKFGKFVSDYGLICSFSAFAIFAVLYELTGNIMFGFNAIWWLGGVIIGYIDYKVEHIETENHRERDIVLAEMKQDFFRVKCMLNDLNPSNSMPLE
jgi:hypothetical protein